MRALKNQRSNFKPPEPTYTDFPLRQPATYSPYGNLGTVRDTEISAKEGRIIDAACIRQAVGYLLQVQKGDCFFAPTRGVIRDTSLFYLLDDMSKRLLESNISDDLLAQEPRISRLEVHVTQDRDNNEALLDIVLQSDMFGRQDISLNFIMSDDGITSVREER